MAVFFSNHVLQPLPTLQSRRLSETFSVGQPVLYISSKGPSGNLASLTASRLPSLHRYCGFDSRYHCKLNMLFRLVAFTLIWIWSCIPRLLILGRRTKCLRISPKRQSEEHGRYTGRCIANCFQPIQ